MMLFEGGNFNPDKAKNAAIAGLWRGFLTQDGLKFALQTTLINCDLVLKGKNTCLTEL
jgi:hypothetical protein